jgi:predicted HTH transcriptional regulator
MSGVAELISEIDGILSEDPISPSSTSFTLSSEFLTLPPLPEFSDVEEFPALESDWLEFKESPASITIGNKGLPLIIGMLNTAGGYIVIGVKDATRQIVGIRTSKEYDLLCLAIDKIYHNKNIVTTNGSYLNPGCVRVTHVVTTRDQVVGVITVRPVKGEKYRSHDGSIYHRLSASNYKEATYTTPLTALEVQRVVESEVARSQHALIKKVKELEKKNVVLSKKVVSYADHIRNQTEALQKSNKVRRFQDDSIVQQKILLAKEKKERELEAARQEQKGSWLFWLLGF